MKYRSVKFHRNWNSFRIICNLILNRNRNDFEIFYIYIRIEIKIYATDLSIWISIEIESNFEVALIPILAKFETKWKNFWFQQNFSHSPPFFSLFYRYISFYQNKIFVKNALYIVFSSTCFLRIFLVVWYLISTCSLFLLVFVWLERYRENSIISKSNETLRLFVAYRRYFVELSKAIVQLEARFRLYRSSLFR